MSARERVGQGQREGRGVVRVGERKLGFGIRDSQKFKIIHFVNLVGSV